MSKDDDKDFSAFVRQHASRHTASADLRSKIRADIALQSAAYLPAPNVTREPKRFWSWLTAAFASGAVAAMALMLVINQWPSDESIRRELVASHVRSMMVSHLTDVASSDQHTVKPWFQGKLNYAPPIQDFVADGFALVGGRLDYVAGQPVSALVYKRQQHLINVFVWPSTAVPAHGRFVADQGFNVRRWYHLGMQFWAVSDLNEQELEAFERLWLPAASGAASRAPS